VEHGLQWSSGAAGRVKSGSAADAFRADMGRLLCEQLRKLIVWLCAIVGVAVTIIGGLGVLFSAVDAGLTPPPAGPSA
jgi:hypothetical protein